jgi:hypothetical protein
MAFLRRGSVLQRRICTCLCAESIDPRKCAIYDQALQRADAEMRSEDYLNRGFAHLTAYDGEKPNSSSVASKYFFQALLRDVNGKYIKEIECGFQQANRDRYRKYCAIDD